MCDDIFYSAELIPNPGTRLIGRKFFYYPSVGSTNETAKEIARQNTVEGVVIAADEQTSGKGRLSRNWQSPPGSLALSVVLTPEVSRLPELIMIASLAVVATIKQVAALKAQIKWPNDVLINGKKVCGILIENEFRRNTLKFSVIGIGINVNLKFSDIPEYNSTATSLYEELGREVSIKEVMKILLVELESLYLSGESIFEEWRDNIVTLGKQIQVTSGKVISKGIADSVDKQGNLWLKQSDGQLVKIVAGDVTLRS